MVVPDDFGGISAIMQWLSYVPKVSNGCYKDVSFFSNNSC